MNRYDYQELRARAVKTQHQDDLDLLGEWFEEYGSNYWNGYCYDADDGLYLEHYYDFSSETAIKHYRFKL